MTHRLLGCVCGESSNLLAEDELHGHVGQSLAFHNEVGVIARDLAFKLHAGEVLHKVGGAVFEYGFYVFASEHLLASSIIRIRYALDYEVAEVLTCQTCKLNVVDCDVGEAVAVVVYNECLAFILLVGTAEACCQCAGICVLRRISDRVVIHEFVAADAEFHFSFQSFAIEFGVH